MMINVAGEVMVNNKLYEVRGFDWETKQYVGVLANYTTAHSSHIAQKKHYIKHSAVDRFWIKQVGEIKLEVKSAGCDADCEGKEVQQAIIKTRKAMVAAQ